MPSIRVQPDMLRAGASHQTAVGSDVRELADGLRGATGGAASAAGDGNAAGAIRSFGTGWASALEYLAATISARGAGVGAAAGAYETTDRCVVPPAGTP